MLFQVLCGFEPIFYTTHPNEEPFFITVSAIFIEKYVGPYAISAVDLYYPVISLLLAVGMMMGIGGNAMIVELIGRGEKEEADRRFSQTIIVAILISVIFAVIGIIFADPIMRLLRCV